MGPSAPRILPTPGLQEVRQGGTEGHSLTLSKAQPEWVGEWGGLGRIRTGRGKVAGSGISHTCSLIINPEGAALGKLCRLVQRGAVLRTRGRGQAGGTGTLRSQSNAEPTAQAPGQGPRLESLSPWESHRDSPGFLLSQRRRHSVRHSPAHSGGPAPELPTTPQPRNPPAPRTRSPSPRPQLQGPQRKAENRKGHGGTRETHSSPSGLATGGLPSHRGPEAKSWACAQLPLLLWKPRPQNCRLLFGARRPTSTLVTSGPPTTREDGGAGRCPVHSGTCSTRPRVPPSPASAVRPGVRSPGPASVPRSGAQGVTCCLGVSLATGQPPASLLDLASWLPLSSRRPRQRQSLASALRPSPSSQAARPGEPGCLP